MSMFEADDVVIPSGKKDAPAQFLHIDGQAGAEVTVPHNLVDENGRPVAPREYRLLGFKQVNTFFVKAMDETTITVRLSEGGSVDLALYV